MPGIDAKRIFEKCKKVTARRHVLCIYSVRYWLLGVCCMKRTLKALFSLKNKQIVLILSDIN